MSGRFVLGAALVVAAYIAGRRDRADGPDGAADGWTWGGAPADIAAAQAETAAAVLAPAPPAPAWDQAPAAAGLRRVETDAPVTQPDEYATLTAILSTPPAAAPAPAAPDPGTPLVEEIAAGWAAGIAGWTHTPASPGVPDVAEAAPATPAPE
ncbi:MAG TPA: hypothetical protein VNT51_07245, partial [Miltoncostaeaceae bacterium]|nr:hypothetical protein [Miltoncostaeaceae bacterium]